MSDIKEVLSKYKSIAMVGVSNDPTKASTIVMKYMQKYGFKVYPVNPRACLLYTSPSPRDISGSRMPSSA